MIFCDMVAESRDHKNLLRRVQYPRERVHKKNSQRAEIGSGTPAVHKKHKGVEMRNACSQKKFTKKLFYSIMTWTLVKLNEHTQEGYIPCCERIIGHI